jgi:flagellar biosynthetic protein FliP
VTMSRLQRGAVRRLVASIALGLVVLVVSAGSAAAATTPTDPGGTVPPVDTIVAIDGGSDVSQTGVQVPDGGSGITVQTPDPIASPSVNTDDGNSIVINSPSGTSNAVLLVLLVTVVALVPGLLLLTTTFPRFLVVLGLARQGLGLNTTPPNQVLAGIAAFLTLFVMGPTFSKINDTAVQPAIKGEITQGEAVKAAWVPLSEFMLARTRTSDLSMLYDMTDTARPADKTEISPRFLIPAFVLSELRTAFIIGFLIWVPFLLIDLIVSTVLASLGMLMMPPVVVSLPVKLALFVLVDGWALLIGSLLRSAGAG